MASVEGGGDAAVLTSKMLRLVDGEGEDGRAVVGDGVVAEGQKTKQTDELRGKCTSHAQLKPTCCSKRTTFMRISPSRFSHSHLDR